MKTLKAFKAAVARKYGKQVREFKVLHSTSYTDAKVNFRTGRVSAARVERVKQTVAIKRGGGMLGIYHHNCRSGEVF